MGCDACWNHLTCFSGNKTGRSRFYLILDSSAFSYIGHLWRTHQLHGNLTIMAKYQLVKIFLVNAQKDSTPFVRVLPLAAHCHQNEVLFTITIRYECCITANPVMILWFGSEEEYDNGNDSSQIKMKLLLLLAVQLLWKHWRSWARFRKLRLSLHCASNIMISR